MKGKREKPKSPIVTTEDVVEMPPELNSEGMEVDLAIDVVFIDNEAFLHTVDRKIKKPSCVVLGTKRKGESYDKQTLFNGLDGILREYNKAEVYVRKIYADNEFDQFSMSLRINGILKKILKPR